jgi:hypothetical protein
MSLTTQFNASVKASFGIKFNCSGAGPAKYFLTDPVITGGLPPYKFFFKNDLDGALVEFTFDQSAEAEIPSTFFTGQFVNVRVVDAENYAIMPQIPYGRNSKPVVASHIVLASASSLTANDGGLRVWNPNEDWYGGLQLQITIATAEDDSNVIRTTRGSYVEDRTLLAGNYSVTVTRDDTCFSRFYVAIPAPPTPVINNFACLLDPLAGKISCSCDVDRNLSERYEIFVASSNSRVLNTSSLAFAELSTFYGCPRCYIPLPLQIRVVHGKYYYVKLTVTGAGGPLSSILEIHVALTRPLYPTSVLVFAQSQGDQAGIQFIWDAPSNPSGSALSYDLMLKQRGGFSTFALASGLFETSFFVNSTVIDSLPFTPSNVVDVIVTTYSLTFDLASLTPEAGIQGSFEYYRTPEVPSGFSFAFETVGSIRTLVVSYPLPLSGMATSTVQVLGRDLSSSSLDWTPMATDSGSRGSTLKTALPTLAFGSRVAYRYIVANGVGWAAGEGNFTFFEAPPLVNFTAQFSTFSSKINTSIDRIECHCYDVVLAAESQASRFQFQWFATSDEAPDWSNALISPFTAGFFSIDVPADGRNIFVRCVAENDAGSTYAVALTDLFVKLRLNRAVSPPNNVRLVSMVPYAVGQISSTWTADWPNVFGATVTGYELKYSGLDCKDEENYIQSTSPEVVIIQRRECPLIVSARVQTNRGPSPWSSDRALAWINVPPSPPLVDILLPDESSSNVEAVFQVSVVVSSLNDATRNVSLTVNSNITGLLGATWLDLGLANFRSVARVGMPSSGDNTRLGDSVIRSLPVRSYPVEYFFRAYSLNGNASQPAEKSVVVIGRPLRPSISSSIAFDPVNSSVIFRWEPEKLDNVTYTGTLTVTSSLGQLKASITIATSGNSVSRTEVVAGDRLELTLVAKTAYRESPIATHSVAAVSGSYWETNATSLVPVFKQFYGMNVTLAWTADRSQHGYNRTSYLIRRSVPGSISSFVEVANIVAADISANGTIEFLFVAPQPMDGIVFTVMPYNPSGQGPTSLPSAPQDFYRNFRDLVAVSGRSIPARFADKATLLLSWQPLPYVGQYSIQLTSADSNADTYTFIDVPCCSVVANVTRWKSYFSSMAVSTAGYGRFPSGSNFIRKLLLPPTAGVPYAVELLSVTERDVSVSGVMMNVSVDFGYFDFSLFYAPAMVVEYSFAGTGSWNESVFTQFNRVDTIRSVALPLPLGACYDFRVYLRSPVGNGEVSNIVSSCSVERPRDIASISIDESLEAMSHPDSTNEFGWMLPLSFEDTAPLGSDVTEYTVSLSQSWCGYIDVPLVSAVRNFCFRSPQLFSFVPGARTSELRRVTTRVPMTSGTMYLITLSATNLWGSRTVFTRTFVPNPIVPIRNVAFTSHIGLQSRSRDLQQISWSFDIIITSTCSAPLRISFPNAVSEGTRNFTLFARNTCDWGPVEYVKYGANLQESRSLCYSISSSSRWHRCQVTSSFLSWFYLPDNLLRVENLAELNSYMNGSVSRSYDLNVDLSKIPLWNSWLIQPISTPDIDVFGYPTSTFDEDLGTFLWTWDFSIESGFQIASAVQAGTVNVTQVVNGVTKNFPFGESGWTGVAYPNGFSTIRFVGPPGTFFTTFEFKTRICNGNSGICFDNVTRSEASFTLQGWGPTVKRFELSPSLSSTGNCILNVVARYNAYNGSDPVTSFSASVSRGEFFYVTKELATDPRGQFSFDLQLQDMRFYLLQVALRTAYLSQSPRSAAAPVIVCSARRTILSVSQYFLNAGGGLNLELTLDPPISEYFKGEFVFSKALVDATRLALGETTVSVSKFTEVTTPALPEGPLNVRYSLDGVLWGPFIQLFVLPAPSNATVSAPSFIRVPDVEVVTLSHPGFAGSGFVLCEWESIATVRATPTNSDRTTWKCDTPSFVPPIPRSVRLNFFSDSVRYPTNTSVTFWDAAAVSVTLTTDTVDGQGCSSYGSSNLVLRVSRWPFPPESRPIYVNLNSYSQDFPDSQFLTFTWNATAGAFTSPFPVLFPGTFEVIVTEAIQGGARMARTLFVHGRDCSPTRSICLTKADRNSCYASSGCTWVSKPRYYGACGLVGDGTTPSSESYVSGFKITNTGIRNFGRVVAFSYKLELPVINDGTITGTMNLSCVSPTLKQRLSPTSVNFLAASSTYSHTCEFLVDPVSDKLTGTFDARADYYMTNPDLFGSRISPNRISFRIGMRVDHPKSNENGEPLVIPPLRTWKDAPSFRASFVNHLLVSSIDVWVLLNNKPELAFQLSNKTISGNSATTLVRPREPIFVDLRNIPYRFTPPGNHRLVITVNRGTDLEETATAVFTVPQFPEAFNWFFAVAEYVPSSTSNCHSRISGLKVCLDVTPESRYDPEWEVNYPNRMMLRLGAVYDPNAMMKPEEDPRKTPAADRTPTGGDEGFRISIELAHSIDTKGVISLGMYLDVTVFILEQSYRLVGDGKAETIFVPSTDTEPPKIEFVSAQLIVTFPAFELAPKGDYPTGLSSGFYFRISFRSEVGVLVKVCNPRYKADQDCYFSIANGLTGGFGGYVGFVLEARAGYSVPILLDVSIYTEGSASMWGTAAKPFRGGSYGAKVCISVTAFFFFSSTYCPGQWYTTYGEPFPNSRGYYKRSLNETMSSRLLENPGWTNEFTPFALPQSWAAKSKRSIPVADEGTLIYNTVPVARPSTAAGRGPNRGIVLMTWTGFDSAKPVPYGSMIMYSVYNSSNEQLSDPVAVRSTNDVDGGSFVFGLSDGRFLLLASVLPNQGASEITSGSSAFTELNWAVFDVSSHIFTAFASLTMDGVYYDGHAAAAEYVDRDSASPTYGEARVMVAWIRMRDSDVTVQSRNNDIMFAVFDPQRNTWSAPAVLVANVGVSDRVSVAALDRTVVLTFSDRRNENQTYAMFVVFDSRTGSWSTPFEVGQSFAYASIPGSNFNASMWELNANVSGPHQQFITVAPKDDIAFVVVWAEDNSIFSRVYSIDTLDNLASGSHPLVQFVWAAQGVTPMNLIVTDVSGETNTVGMMMSWQYSKGGIFHRAQLVMLTLADHWELLPVISQSSANFTVLSAAVFAARDDTAFVINAEQELLYDPATARQSPDKVSIKYKRINLLPILLVQSVAVSIPQVSSFEGHILDVSLLIENKGAFPASDHRVAAVHGSFDSFAGISEEDAIIPLPSIRGGLNYTVLLRSVTFSSLRDGGYIWVHVVNSSAVPVRVPLFKAAFSNLIALPSQDASQVTVSVAVSCSPLLTDSIFGDLFAGAPVSFYTVGDNSTQEFLLGQVIANCSMDSNANAARASLSVPLALLKAKLVARFTAQDDHALPFDVQEVSYATISLKTSPDLVVINSAVHVINPFVGLARSVARIDNTGLRASQNVTVKLINAATNETIGVTHFANISGLSSVVVEFPISESVIRTSGQYNLTWSAMSEQSTIAWRDSYVYAEMANFPNANISELAKPDQTHLENAYADNFFTIREVMFYSPVVLKIDRASAALSVEDPVELHLVATNAHSSAAGMNIPIFSFLSSVELDRTLIAESSITVEPMSSVVVSFTPLASVVSSLKYYEQIGAQPLITIVVPAMFSGTNEPIIITIPLVSLLNRTVPSAEVDIEGVPAIQVPDSFAVLPGQTRSATIQMVNIPPANLSSFSLRLLSGGPAVSFDDEFFVISYTAPESPTSSISVYATIGLLLSDGTVFESKQISFYVSVASVTTAPFDVFISRPPTEPAPVAPPTLPPVAAPVAAPVSPPVATPKAAPIGAPIAAPIAAPTAAPSAGPAVPVTAPIATPIVSPATSPIAAPVVSPSAVPVAAPVSTPVVPPVSAPTASPVAIPVASPIASPSAVPVAVAPVFAPIATPVASPTAVPTAAAPVFAPIAAPVATPQAAPVASPVSSSPPTAAPLAVAPISSPSSTPMAVPAAPPTFPPVALAPVALAPTQTPSIAPESTPATSPVSVPAPSQSIVFYIRLSRANPPTVDELVQIRLSISNTLNISASSIEITWSAAPAARKRDAAAEYLIGVTVTGAAEVSAVVAYFSDPNAAANMQDRLRQDIPSLGSSVTVSPPASPASPTYVPTASPSSQTSAPVDASANSNGLSPGATAGIAIAVILVALIAVGIVVFVVLSRRKKQGGGFAPWDKKGSSTPVVTPTTAKNSVPLKEISKGASREQSDSIESIEDTLQASSYESSSISTEASSRTSSSAASGDGSEENQDTKTASEDEENEDSVRTSQDESETNSGQTRSWSPSVSRSELSHSESELDGSASGSASPSASASYSVSAESEVHFDSNDESNG